MSLDPTPSAVGPFGWAGAKHKLKVKLVCTLHELQVSNTVHTSTDMKGMHSRRLVGVCKIQL